MKYYVVDWDGSFTFDEVIDEKGWDDDAELYAICHEPPTRQNRTLYVGVSTR
ncbi:MAG: hypothetical protein GF411_20025 [Candidatus Lokiarchaeota archaeon]|nr:hypothetical protein [Candidatus Lokiarchaeota archaeon]